MTIIQTAAAPRVGESAYHCSGPELMWSHEGAQAWRAMCSRATDGRWDCIHDPDEDCPVARLALEAVAA